MYNIFDIATYTGCSLLSKGLSVSPLKLQKLLYYEQSWYMVFFGRENTLFAEHPQAWVNGPVYPTIFYKYRDMTKDMCEHLHADAFCKKGSSLEDTMYEIVKKCNFSNDEIDLLESIITLYGAKSQNQLIFLTHAEQPWSDMREGLLPYERSTKELSFDTMYNYYKARHERNMQKHND